MIQDKTLAGKIHRQPERGLKLSREYQQIVSQIELRQLCDSSAKIRPQYKTVIRLVLHDVPRAHQLWMPAVFFKLFRQPGRTQVQPADHTFDETVSFGQAKKPFRFLQRLPRLHGD